MDVVLHPQASRSPGVPGAIAVLAAAPALLLVHALAPSPTAVELRVLGALPGAVACVLWWRYFVAAEPDRLPFLEYAVTQVYLYWGLATVTGGAEPGRAAAGLPGAVAATCVVAAGLLLAHPAGRRLGACGAQALGQCLPRAAPRLRPAVIVPWLGLTAAIQADLLADRIPGSLAFLVQTVGGYAPLLAAIAWRDMGAGQAGGARRSPWLAVCTATLSLAGLLTGMLEAAVQPVLMALTLQVVLRRRIPWRLLAAGAVIVLVVNPAKHRYREVAWEDATRQDRGARDPWVAAQRWGRAIGETWAPGAAARSTSASGLASRLDELAINAEVITRTPAGVPFDRGGGWAYIPLSVVPRLLYPDKPDFTAVYNDRFAVVFGFQTPAETATSTSAFPLVSDGYWNLGWPGVVLVSLAVGLLVGAFGGLFRARSWGTVTVAISTFAHLHANNALGVQMIGVPQHVVGLAAVLWLVRLVSRAVDAAGRPARDRAAWAPAGWGGAGR